MAHWMRSSSSATSQIKKEYTASDKNGNAECREVKMLSMEAMRSSVDENRDVLTLGPGGKDVRSDFQPINEVRTQRSIGIENGFSLRHSENLNAEWNHFPMFDINHKLECILASKKISKFGTTAVTMREPQFANNEPMLRPSNATSQIHLENDQYHYCSHSSFLSSEVKNDNQRNGGCSVSRLQNETMQLLTNCYHLDGTSLPFLFHEQGKETGSTSGSTASHGIAPGVRKISRSKSPCLLSHEMQKCSNTAQYHAFTKKIAMDSIDGDTSKSTELHGSTLFETTKLPTTLECHDSRVVNLKFLEHSTGSKEKEGEFVIDANFFKEQRDSSFNKDTVHIDANQSPILTKGETSSSYQKGVMTPQRIAFPVKQAIDRKDGTSLQDVNKLSKSSENTRVLSVSRTESMDADHILCSVEMPDISQFTPMVESSSHPESSNTRFKHLWHDPPGCFALGTKKLKFTDARGSGRACTLFNQILNYKGSSSQLATCTKEQTESDRAMLPTEKGECSSQESEKKIDSWIRRWRHGGHQMASQAEAVPVLCKVEITKSVPEKLDAKQVPSIAAMALMGKALSNFRPHQFRRKGSSVVWNTEESNSH